jgi:hypothetical protein
VEQRVDVCSDGISPVFSIGADADAHTVEITGSAEVIASKADK